MNVEWAGGAGEGGREQGARLETGWDQRVLGGSDHVELASSLAQIECLLLLGAFLVLFSHHPVAFLHLPAIGSPLCPHVFHGTHYLAGIRT